MAAPSAKQLRFPDLITGTRSLAPGVTAGLDATGATDMTSVFSSIISTLPAGSTLKVWPGVYKLTTGTIAIPADRITLDFTGCTVNIDLPAGTNWATTGFNILINGSSRTGTTIRGGKWVCAGDPAAGAGQFKNAYKARVFGAHPAYNTTLDSLTCEGCTLSRIVSGDTVTVIRPKGNNTESGINYQQGGTESFVLFPLTSNWRVTEPDINGYGHGIHFDGGNAAVSGVDVPLSTARGLSVGRVIGGWIRNCSGGGVWGGMGKDVTVSFVTVENCGDVGIDFEGCIDCKGLYNTVSDCGHNSGAGCLTAFSICSGIVFEGGTVSISASGHKFIGVLSNATNTASTWPGDITFRGITFINNQTGTLRVVQPSSHYQRVAVEGCTFINAGLDWSNVASYTQAIENNKFFITDTTLTAGSFGVLTAGSVRGTSTLPGSLVLRNNSLRCAVAPNVGITLFSNDGTYAVEEIIEGNRTRGCNIDFNPKFTINNATTPPVRTNRLNIWGNGNVFAQEPATGSQSINNLDLNRDGTGAIYPAGSGGGSSYTLPAATASVRGGIKVGARLGVDGDVLNVVDRATYENLLQAVTFFNTTAPGHFLQQIQSSGTSAYTARSGGTGFYSLGSGATTSSRNALYTSANALSIASGGLGFALEFVGLVPTFSDGTNTFTALVGILDSVTSTPANGVYFDLSGSSLQAFVRSGGSNLANPTGLLTLTAGTLYRLRIEITATSVKLYAKTEPDAGQNELDWPWVAGDIKYTNASLTLPTGAIGFGAYVQKSAGTTNRVLGIQTIQIATLK